jgi:ABC-type multidrug transport system ATPase subunit
MLIMDEPNQYLDIESEEKFFEKLSDLSKSKTIIMSLHDMNYIKKLADNLIVLDNGKIIFNDLAANY